MRFITTVEKIIKYNKVYAYKYNTINPSLKMKTRKLFCKFNNSKPEQDEKHSNILQ